MTDEEFLLLRGMVSLAQVDDWYSAEEDQIIRARGNKLGMTPAQERELHHERRNPLDPVMIYERLPSMRAKGMFLTVARTLFHSDGEFCAKEQDVMARLDALHEEAVAEIMPQLQKDLTTARHMADINIMNARTSAERRGMFGRLVDWMFD